MAPHVRLPKMPRDTQIPRGQHKVIWGSFDSNFSALSHGSVKYKHGTIPSRRGSTQGHLGFHSRANFPFYRMEASNTKTAQYLAAGDQKKVIWHSFDSKCSALTHGSVKNKNGSIPSRRGTKEGDLAFIR